MNERPNPYDGLRVTTKYVVSELVPGVQFEAVCIAAMGAGETRSESEIFRFPAGEVVDTGVASRKTRLLEAICRYFNAGGTALEMEELCSTVVDRFWNLSLVIPGYVLLRQSLEVVGEEIIYANLETSHCWIVHPDTVTDECNLTDLLNE